MADEPSRSDLESIRARMDKLAHEIGEMEPDDPRREELMNELSELYDLMKKKKQQQGSD